MYKAALLSIQMGCFFFAATLFKDINCCLFKRVKHTRTDVTYNARMSRNLIKGRQLPKDNISFRLTFEINKRKVTTHIRKICGRDGHPHNHAGELIVVSVGEYDQMSPNVAPSWIMTTIFPASMWLRVDYDAVTLFWCGQVSLTCER